MVSAGEMNQADLAGVLQTIAQQQTAIFQQQAALLQVHSETVHLQRLLVEHMLSNQADAAASAYREIPASAFAPRNSSTDLLPPFDPLAARDTP